MWEFWRSRLSKGKTRHRRRPGSDDESPTTRLGFAQQLEFDVNLALFNTVQPCTCWIEATSGALQPSQQSHCGVKALAREALHARLVKRSWNSVVLADAALASTSSALWASLRMLGKLVRPCHGHLGQSGHIIQQ